MKLNATDYELERSADGGYYDWMTTNMQLNAYGESPEEAVINLQEALEEMEDAGVRRRFLRGVRNRLKLSMVSVREDDGVGKK